MIVSSCVVTWYSSTHAQTSQSLNILYSMYYLTFYVTLLIRKAMNAVTVMFAVMKIIQNIINAVTVMPVNVSNRI